MYRKERKNCIFYNSLNFAIESEAYISAPQGKYFKSIEEIKIIQIHFHIIKDMSFANIAFIRITLISNMIEGEFIVSKKIIFINKIMQVS